MRALLVQENYKMCLRGIIRFKNLFHVRKNAVENISKLRVLINF